MAQTYEAAKQVLESRPVVKAAEVARPDRGFIDLMISWSGAVVAVLLIALGAAAIYGGSFAQSNVRDRLQPQHISFPPASAMTVQERAEVGTFAGQTVDTGTEAEAFSRYIAGHLREVNNGATYSETSAAARAEGVAPKVAADLQAKAAVLFQGETLRSILLNAYGWWTVGTIVMWAGIGAAIAGLLLSLFVGLGFFHARKERSRIPALQ
jgi:hypothetical protein